MVDYTVPADHRIKLKESEMKDTFLDLARELCKFSDIISMTSEFLIIYETIYLTHSSVPDRCCQTLQRSSSQHSPEI